MRQWNDLFKKTAFVIDASQVFEIFFATNANAGFLFACKSNLLAEHLNDPWPNAGGKCRIIIIIEVDAVFDKSQGAHRCYEEPAIKFFNTTIGIDHFINEFSGEF